MSPSKSKAEAMEELDSDIERVVIRGERTSVSITRRTRSDGSYSWFLETDREDLEGRHGFGWVETYPEARDLARALVADLDKALGAVYRGRQAIQKAVDGLNQRDFMALVQARSNPEG